MWFLSLRSFALIGAILYLTACSSSQDKVENYPEPPLVEPSASYAKPHDLQNFADYVLFLKGKAFSQGVSAKTLYEQQNIQFIQSAVDLDHKQAGKTKKKTPKAAVSIVKAPPAQTATSESTINQENTTIQPKTISAQTKTKKKSKKVRRVNDATTRYLNRVITAKKVQLAKELYQQHQPLLQQISQQFNVPAEYIVALWGMESSFGRYQGKYDVLSVLATLAFEGRRENLFSREFIAALKMLDQQAISREKMLGSWAGAMGQTQFMPSSYLRYGVDANQDKQKDIWKTQDDVFASIANYLSSVGWEPNAVWGVEVSAGKSVVNKFSGVGFNKKRSLAQWQKLGVKVKFAKSLSTEKRAALMNYPLWLVSPEGSKGRVFLVTNNYRTLLNWNNSNHFALSIGMFAERIKGF